MSKWKNKEYINAYNKEYRKTHKEALSEGIKKSNKKYRQANKERLNAYAKIYQPKYRKRNLLRLRELDKLRHLRYREKRLEEFKRYRIKNKEKVISTTKEWRKQNKYRIRAYIHQRRERNRKVGFLTKKDIQLVYENNIKKYGTLTCYLCLKPIEFGQDNIEHKTPLSRGGTNEIKNLGIAHRMCNLKKYTQTFEEWYASRRNKSRESITSPDELARKSI